MSDKLPEWQDRSRMSALTSALLERDAALARMEALAEVVQDLIDERGSPDAPLQQRINALLAACVRKEER